MTAIEQFLQCTTPDAWLENATNELDILLIDHAHCEKKAASMALKLMHRYPERLDLVRAMATLAREELLHFEQVMNVLESRKVAFRNLKPSGYAQALHDMVRSDREERLVDLLLIGALIEARSCERFARLVPVLDGRLAQFYQRLYVAEARHFEIYLEFAAQVAGRSLAGRIDRLAAREAELINRTDDVFRFHSGPVGGS